MAEKAKARKNEARVLLVDDHPIVRAGLAQLINSEDGLDVCGEADTAAEGLRAVKKLKPDIAVIDIALPDRNGLELIKDLRHSHPHVATLALSMHDENLYAERALRAGAGGYVMKDQANQTIREAIHRVLAGSVYVSDSMSAKLLNRLAGHQPQQATSPIEALTDRELEVYELIGQGYGTSDVAGKLRLSTKTIETYRAKIKEKLNLLDATALRRHAIQWVQNRDLI